MVDILLDSSIIIDLLRNFEPAAIWLSSEKTPNIGITKFVWLEAVFGADSTRELDRTTTLLKNFEIIPISVADVDWALRRLTKLTLAHNSIDPMDALIASTSYRLSIPLCTRNLKHLRPLLGSLAISPY